MVATPNQCYLTRRREPYRQRQSDGRDRFLHSCVTLTKTCISGSVVIRLSNVSPEARSGEISILLDLFADGLNLLLAGLPPIRIAVFLFDSHIDSDIDSLFPGISFLDYPKFAIDDVNDKEWFAHVVLSKTKVSVAQMARRASMTFCRSSRHRSISWMKSSGSVVNVSSATSPPSNNSVRR